MSDTPHSLDLARRPRLRLACARRRVGATRQLREKSVRVVRHQPRRCRLLIKGAVHTEGVRVDGTGNKTAVVVGGGLGGLAAAVGLHRAGWDTRVVERAASFGELSVGLTLAANGLRALDVLGLGAAVREGGRAAVMPGTQTPSGRWLRRANATGDPNRAGTATLSISRVTLHRILREALPRQALMAQTAVVGVRPGGSQALVWRGRRAGRSAGCRRVGGPTSVVRGLAGPGAFTAGRHRRARSAARGPLRPGQRPVELRDRPGGPAVATPPTRCRRP